ncbi:translation elongation factor Ts [Ruminococcus flavefaciens]|uniref:Elongation factor Ts n=1 Tax=Ruminococcus flavefaciens TaxID=1265 RepID=A0A315Y473_RUMFL|nr:translation elongation factor Ts [Ruminococcus flavefaciens]MBQ6169374.1 elongation factor Ts [Ruminococcus sp.]PWJ15471.1 elongation factor Ts [Ruminococcus flavefaciens]SSA40650.1 elongation factor Ts [Ruminococcus flavefaciens]
MGKVSVAEIKELMKSTGVGMMDCKKALEENDGDMDKAIEFLREKGLATQAKKSGRAAAEGVVTAVVKGEVGVLLEVNTETDFAANTDDIRNFVANVANTIIEKNPADVEALKEMQISGGSNTVGEVLTELAGMKIRENIVIRRFVRLEGKLASYIHNGGSIGVLVKMDTDLAADQVASIGKDVAMQSAALNAAYLCREQVPAEVLEKEKEIMMAQMAEDPKMASKPEQVRAKIVEGKIGKYYSENCLLEQAFVKDDKMSVQGYVDAEAKKLGGSIKVVDVVRYERGEGVEKKEDNLADEIAKMIK